LQWHWARAFLEGVGVDLGGGSASYGKRSRLYIERTGDNVSIAWGHCGVVFDDVSVALGVGSVFFFYSNGVKVKVQGAFDGVNNGIRAGQDITVAYESWAGGTGQGEGNSNRLGGAFKGGGRGIAAVACSKGFCPCDSGDRFIVIYNNGDCDTLVGTVREGLTKMWIWCFCIIRSFNVSAKRQS
jgi:hypothetical protein